MSVKITETPQGTHLVNGIEVYEDLDGKYIAKGLLVEPEIKAFRNYMNQLKKAKVKEVSIAERLIEINTKLSNIKMQREFLDRKDDLLSEESIKLRRYYEKMKDKYTEMRNNIIANLKVTSEAV